MKVLALAALAALSLAACRGDETVRAYGAADQVWTLSEIDGTPFDASATLTFPDAGRIAGAAPCNRYSADMTVPYPWFEAGPIAATRRACPELAAETAFLTALGQATLAEVAGETLILSNPEGLNMVFRSGG